MAAGTWPSGVMQEAGFLLHGRPTRAPALVAPQLLGLLARAIKLRACACHGIGARWFGAQRYCL